VKLHLGVDPDFRPATKAHPALLVKGLRELVERLRGANVAVVDEPLAGHDRVYVTDPFGNRLELMEPRSTGAADRAGRMRTTTIALLLLVAVLSGGCGYFMSGTWEDDPKNWGRAFDSIQPPDVTVVHSKYWRSPHWSYEFEYFFEIVPSAELKQQLFSDNSLRQLVGAEASKAQAGVPHGSLSWFVPESSAGYEVWVFADDPRSRFMVFIDKESGHLFMTDSQR
jgi:hypothetical protein